MGFVLEARQGAQPGMWTRSLDSSPHGPLYGGKVLLKFPPNMTDGFHEPVFNKRGRKEKRKEEKKRKKRKEKKKRLA